MKALKLNRLKFNISFHKKNYFFFKNFSNIIFKIYYNFNFVLEWGVEHLTMRSLAHLYVSESMLTLMSAFYLSNKEMLNITNVILIYFNSQPFY